MKRVPRSIVWSIGFGAFLFAVSVVGAFGQNITYQILRRMDSNNKSIQVLRANLTMVKFNSALKVSDQSFGTFTYLPKKGPNHEMRVRTDWSKPDNEQISIVGRNYELYRPRINQLISGKVEKARKQQDVGYPFGFIQMTKEQFRAYYEIRFLGEEKITGDRPTWHLQLVPKPKSRNYPADLWVDSSGMLLQTKISERNGDTTTVRLSDIMNQSLEDMIFKLKYPDSVKKIRGF
jgi:outer membrane lipoprotein-sorting protein